MSLVWLLEIRLRCFDPEHNGHHRFVEDDILYQLARPPRNKLLQEPFAAQGSKPCRVMEASRNVASSKPGFGEIGL